MNLIDDKIDDVCGELSRVTGSHLEGFSAEELGSMIEALLKNKFDLEDIEK